MPKKKVTKKNEDGTENEKGVEELAEEETVGEDTLDPAIIEDTFSEEFSEYNDVDNF